MQTVLELRGPKLAGLESADDLFHLAVAAVTFLPFVRHTRLPLKRTEPRARAGVRSGSPTVGEGVHAMTCDALPDGRASASNREASARGSVKKRGGSNSLDPPRLGRNGLWPLLGGPVGAPRQARLVARGGVAVEHALLHGLVYERDGRRQTLPPVP